MAIYHILGVINQYTLFILLAIGSTCVFCTYLHCVFVLCFEYFFTSWHYKIHGLTLYV